MRDTIAQRLRELRVRPTVGARERQRWEELMAAHHYLPFRTLVGRSLRHVGVLGERWHAFIGWHAGTLARLSSGPGMWQVHPRRRASQPRGARRPRRRRRTLLRAGPRTGGHRPQEQRDLRRSHPRVGARPRRAGRHPRRPAHPGSHRTPPRRILPGTLRHDGREVQSARPARRPGRPRLRATRGPRHRASHQLRPWTTPSASGPASTAPLAPALPHPAVSDGTKKCSCPRQ